MISPRFKKSYKTDTLSRILASDIPDEALVDMVEHIANINLLGILHPEKANPRELASISIMFSEAVIGLLHNHPDLGKEFMEHMPANLVLTSNKTIDLQPVDYNFAKIKDIGKAEDIETEANISVKKADISPSIER